LLLLSPNSEIIGGVRSFAGPHHPMLIGLVGAALLLVSLGGTRASAASSAACTTRGPILLSYKIEKHPAFDRVVFPFRGGLPEQQCRGYVPRVLAEGSGLAVRLEGRVFFHLTFFRARGHDASCRSTAAERVASPHLSVLLQIKPAGDFEGHVSFGLGLSRHNGYHVFTLRHPARVVLDLPH
jgi:hypothetical protein